VERSLERILAGAGTRNPYAASVFRELCLVALDAVRRTNSQTLSAAKAIIDKAQTDYEAGNAIPRNTEAHAVINAAKAAQIRAVNAMVTYEQLKARKTSASVLATAKAKVDAALPDLPSLIASIAKLYSSVPK
jgi:hypothetical protein